MRTLKNMKRNAPPVDNPFEPVPGTAPANQHERGRTKNNVAPSPREYLTSLTEGSEAGFRRLKPNERVMHGDYIENGISDYRLWDGPTGFRADSFLNKVYRAIQKSHDQPL